MIQWIEIYPVDSAIHRARVVQTLDGAKITIQWISIRETNCSIQWIEINAVDNKSLSNG